MKKDTKNLLILGAAGLGAYFLFVKPALSKIPTAEQVGEAAGGAVVGGAIGFSEGMLGLIVSPFQNVINSLLGMLSSGAAAAGGAVTNIIPQPSMNQAPVLATSFNTSAYRPQNVSAALVNNSAQAQTSSYFGVSAPSSVNYLASVGRGTPAATFQNQSGTYNASTGTFTNTRGQMSSVAAYYVKPAATYAPATKPFVNPLAPTKSTIFKY